MNGNFDITYNTLFHKYYSNLLYYATRFLSDDEAEDVVQDVFVDLWKRRDSIEVGEQIQAFLYRAVYTKSINVLKHKKIENNYGAEVEELYKRKLEFYQPDYNDTIKRIENTELRKEIYQVINELPDKCKEVFKLSYLHGMKNKEIAEALDISMRTVEAHMYKALRFLRERLSHLIILLILIILRW
ncbi:MAG: RNA polymerase sigma-70 factor [Bacteroidaceae bacterium]